MKRLSRWAEMGLQTDSPTATRYGFRVASQHAAPMYWDLLHIDLKTAFLQGETYVQLEPIGVPTYVMMEHLRKMTCPQVQRLPSKSRTTWTRHQAR